MGKLNIILIKQTTCPTSQYIEMRPKNINLIFVYTIKCSSQSIEMDEMKSKTKKRIALQIKKIKTKAKWPPKKGFTKMAGEIKRKYFHHEPWTSIQTHTIHCRKIRRFFHIISNWTGKKRLRINKFLLIIGDSFSAFCFSRSSTCTSWAV